ncbi:MAG TPA: NADH-quinone oxidoreductase subunit N [Lacipirellulaceae bacterium]|nr:NADH-quinone oxidoreductase subunit N [Lacipirellulaceae bacterium]
MPDFLPNAGSAILTIAPEAILLATVCLMLLLGPFLVDETGRSDEGVGRRWTILSLITLGIAGWVFINTSGRAGVPGEFFALDGLTFFVRGLTLGLGPVLVLMLTRQIDDGSSAEAHACLLTLLAGTNFVAMATDLVGLFLALEMVSIPTYIYLYLPRRDAMMQEAALKYFLLSVFSSAFVLFGMSWLFGATGSTKLDVISTQLAAAISQVASGTSPESVAAELAHPRMLLAALAILAAGLSFRLAAVPFHFYAPDVFQGANSSSAAMLSLVPKVAGFAALLRVLPHGGEWLAEHLSDAPVQGLFAVLAIITTTLGNLLAVRQRNLHRLLAYSSIAHSGYMLVGLAMGEGIATIGGVTALWFYLATYGLVTVGVFSLLAAASADRPLETDADLAGLSQTHPAIAMLLAVSLFSLTGLPPTAGFWGKFNLLQASWSSTSPWGVALAVAIAVNAAIAAWYYLRLIAAMYREPAVPSTRGPLALAPAAAGAACAVGAVLLFAAPQRLLDLAALAAG